MLTSVIIVRKTVCWSMRSNTFLARQMSQNEPSSDTSLNMLQLCLSINVSMQCIIATRLQRDFHSQNDVTWHDFVVFFFLRLMILTSDKLKHEMNSPMFLPRSQRLDSWMQSITMNGDWSCKMNFTLGTSIPMTKGLVQILMTLPMLQHCSKNTFFLH